MFSISLMNLNIQQQFTLFDEDEIKNISSPKLAIITTFILIILEVFRLLYRSIIHSKSYFTSSYWLYMKRIKGLYGFKPRDINKILKKLWGPKVEKFLFKSFEGPRNWNIFTEYPWSEQFISFIIKKFQMRFEVEPDLEVANWGTRSKLCGNKTLAVYLRLRCDYLSFFYLSILYSYM